ncbi:MAG TPA: S41 family peptidase [Candidatus Acidoferrales bacterium]|jgi:carboxyl-terminal processing protease|nr:S41 family peptidase [Candidatus Acidoferrales bacterium]
MERSKLSKSSGSAARGIGLLILVLAVSAILGGFYGPAATATSAGSPNSDDLQDSVKSFTRVLSVVQRNYADPVDTDKVIYDGAIPGMLHVLDPHSNFFDPKQYALFREEQEGKYYGVGMIVEQRDNQTVVQAPFVNSPAYKAGIRPGDTILKVDGKTCTGLTTNQVADMLKGAKGTPVHITLGREGWDKPIEVTVVRDEIPRPGVEYSEMVKPGIGYVHVTTFNETTDDDLKSALKQLDWSKLDGLVIDLRDNGGGLLNQAVGMADLFLDKNELVVSHRGRSSPERPYYAVMGNQGIDVPLVVLVNGQSASASEIVSGAIQDHDRGLIVGETTFGKGLVQTQFPLSEDTALLLTTARYYTPSGRLIQRNYKNVTLYDYHYNPQRPRKPDVKLTDTGRQVFGEGGITPDVVVAEPKADPFEELLEERGVLYPLPAGVGDFARYYLGQNREVTKDFQVDDAVLADFQKYLNQQHIPFTPDQIQRNTPWLKWEIKREIFTTVFGLDAGYKVQLENDPQLQQAIESLPQAKALYATARKVVAQRENSGVLGNPNP